MAHSNSNQPPSYEYAPPVGPPPSQNQYSYSPPQNQYAQDPQSHTPYSPPQNQYSHSPSQTPYQSDSYAPPPRSQSPFSHSEPYSPPPQQQNQRYSPPQTYQNQRQDSPPPNLPPRTNTLSSSMLPQGNDRTHQVEVLQSYEASAPPPSEDDANVAMLQREFPKIEGSLIAAIYGDSKSLSATREMLGALEEG